MMNVKLEAPWERYRKMVDALFKADDKVQVSDIESDDGGYVLSVLVYDHEKFLALDRALRKKVVFGNVTLHVDVYDMENEASDGLALFREVFRDNPIAQEIVSRKDRAGVDWDFVCFRPQVVQFFDDDLTDINGNFTGLAEDIAREVFAGNERGVNFCTAALEETACAQDA